MSSPPHAASSDAELPLLLHLTRVALGHETRPPDTNRVAWPRFLALVERHRLAPLLHGRAAAVVAQMCPSSVASALAHAAAQNTRRALAQTAELRRLHDALAADGIAVRTLKGPALARQLHGGLAARWAGDIDLVVAAADVGRADTRLRALGLTRIWPEFELTPRQWREFLRIKSDFEYDAPGRGPRVELHWRLEGLIGEPPLTTVELAGRAVPTLALPEHALFLFHHGARHGWFRLFWLVDIAVLLKDPAIDWAALRRQATAAGGERALAQGVALAVAWLGAPRPPALADLAADASLVAEAERQLRREPAVDEPFLEWARQLRYRVALERSVAAKWRVLTPHVFTPSNWRVWRLPDRWFWLYFPATPFLWLWRYLRR